MANVGRLGATRQSWSRDNIRPYILELLETHANANEDELAALLSEQLADNKEFRSAAAEYLLSNAVNALRGYEQRQQSRQPNSPEVVARRAAIRAVTVEHIKAQIILLNSVLTNGKKARFCTRAEIEAHAEAQACDAAGWRRIAKRIPAGKLLGQALDEEEARALYSK